MIEIRDHPVDGSFGHQRNVAADDQRRGRHARENAGVIERKDAARSRIESQSPPREFFAARAPFARGHIRDQPADLRADMPLLRRQDRWVVVGEGAHGIGPRGG